MHYITKRQQILNFNLFGKFPEVVNSGF